MKLYHRIDSQINIVELILDTNYLISWLSCSTKNVLTVFINWIFRDYKNPQTFTFKAPTVLKLTTLVSMQYFPETGASVVY